jgi:IclR family pca regulon transcriptional regulator
VPDTARERLLASIALEGFTPATITVRDDLEAELEQVARQGYALVDQELEIGLRSVAVPIHGPAGTVVAAVNVSVPAASMTAAEMRAALLPALRETATAIERDLLLVPG